jgi:pyruvate formate lyase activating enzyme
MNDPPLWRQAPGGQIQRIRRAEHWHRPASRTAPPGQLACTLCYRKCVLAPGETGFCGFRGNRSGRMELLSHGIITSLVRQVHGYGPDPFMIFKPGQTSLFLGGIQCTSSCTFCMSAAIIHKPGAVPWAGGREQMITADSLLYGQKALMHPLDAVKAAAEHHASSLTFGINEPTLSIEWTTDVARLARQRGC